MHTHAHTCARTHKHTGNKATAMPKAAKKKPLGEGRKSSGSGGASGQDGGAVGGVAGGGVSSASQMSEKNKMLHKSPVNLLYWFTVPALQVQKYKY
jgi:hypothetical protein